MILLNLFKSLLKKVYYKWNSFLIHIQEKTFRNGIKYILKNNHSEILLIIFSGISGDCNYSHSLKNSTWDQLYIKDTWADGISY